jgi:F-type H+-transporting ATPase subunit b
VQIDYFTIVAQIINFLVLVILLRHFLYRPVIKTMDEREQRMVSRLKDADQKTKEAEQEAENFRRMKHELEDKRQEMLAKTTEEVQALRSDLMKKARAEVEASIADWYQSFERQKESILADLRLRTGEVVYAITRRAIQDLANEKLEAQIIDTFILRLREMGVAGNEEIKEFFNPLGQSITIRSTFEIPGETRQIILKTMRNLSGKDLEIKFETSPELISGVEMRNSDTRIGWNIASYLETLKADLLIMSLKGATGKLPPSEEKRNGQRE